MARDDNVTRRSRLRDRVSSSKNCDSGAQVSTGRSEGDAAVYGNCVCLLVSVIQKPVEHPDSESECESMTLPVDDDVPVLFVYLCSRRKLALQVPVSPVAAPQSPSAAQLRVASTRGYARAKGLCPGKRAVVRVKQGSQFASCVILFLEAVSWPSAD
jgi:hypothetical protein